MNNDSENLEHGDIGRLLGSLKQIDPPGDFDVRVRARIAQGRPAAKSKWMLAPAAATLLVMAAAGYLGFRSYYLPQQQASLTPPAMGKQEIELRGMPTTGDTASNSSEGPADHDQPIADLDDRPVDKIVTPTTREQTRDPIGSSPREQQPSITKPLDRRPEKAKTSDKEPGGGTRVDASKIGPVITAPVRTGQLTKEVLSSFGIDASNSGAGWTVGEVQQNSRAQRSGLKTGDVIESIRNTTVHLRRDGKAVQITLVP